MSNLPLGKRESDRLEFKSADALKDPGKLGRAVVAFLNSAGGELWVGLEEEQSVAVRVTPVQDPERARQRLHDSLVDRVEPALQSDELAIDVVDGAVLRLRVRPGKNRGPYSLLSGDSRAFVKRIHERNRPMSREELQSAFRDSQEDGSWTGRLTTERQKNRGEILWMAFLPRPARPELELDLEAVEPLLDDPRRTGNRPEGWSFATEYGEIRLKKGCRVKQGEDWRLEIHRDGLITLRLPLAHLHHQGPAGWIWPPALLEYPTSVFRLARQVYAGHDLQEVAVDLALLHVAGWTLRPHTVGSLRNQLGEVPPFSDDEDLVWSRPLVYLGRELEESPDRCAYRWIKLVYEAFGYTEHQIPVEFHPEHGLSFARR